MTFFPQFFEVKKIRKSLFLKDRKHISGYKFSILMIKIPKSINYFDLIELVKD